MERCEEEDVGTSVHTKEMTRSKNSGRGPKRRRSVFDIAVAILVLVAALWMFGPSILNWGGTNDVDIDPSASESLRQLSELHTVEEDANEGIPSYSRTEFGSGWADLDRDGCNTRNEILARDLTDITYQSDTDTCVIVSGVFVEPYTGQTVEFTRGQGTSELVQIDHVVPLADAWYRGAWEWDGEERIRFANDPLNLLAADGRANQSKGASTADKWLPANEDFWCEYTARQVAVKYRWDLAVTHDELAALNDVLNDCLDTVVTQ